MITLDQIKDLCEKHRVEVLVQEDHLYHCYIDYKQGDGCWGTGLNFLDALDTGLQAWMSCHGDPSKFRHTAAEMPPHSEGTANPLRAGGQVSDDLEDEHLNFLHNNII